METLNLFTRTDLRLTSKTSINFKVQIGKSLFEKKPNDDGGSSFTMTDLEDPKNPRKNSVFPDESKFITVMMNRVYYQQEKGIKNPIIVIQRLPIPELPDAITVEEPKPAAKTAKKVAKVAKKVVGKAKA